MSQPSFGIVLGDGGLSWKSDLDGRRSGLGCAEPTPGVDAKCDRFPCERLKAIPDSDCLLKASKSGFESKGRCIGEVAAAAPKERMDEVGGLQLSLGPILESRGSLLGSIMRPK